ncbi:MAG: transglutaminase TgpA family protein [Thermoanaerobaculia bacterium]
MSGAPAAGAPAARRPVHRPLAGAGEPPADPPAGGRRSRRIRGSRELETLLLPMFAAVPLYFTYAISAVSLVLFHVFMTAIVVRVASGRGPELIPASLMRWLAIAYVPFYVIDAAFVSRSAIAASTHLVLFIAVYQPIESSHRDNQAQRILTAALIFTASLATSTHLAIVPFVVVFAFFMFRQLMGLSHLETARAIGRQYAEAASGRAAGFYLIGAFVIGALLFPVLPRLRNPIVRGLTGPLPGATTALSDTINLNQRRVTPNDATVVARVWLDRETRPFFTPLRLRGSIYDRFENGEWRQSVRGLRVVSQRGDTFLLAKAKGIEREAIVEMRAQKGKVFLPVGAVALSGVATLYEGPMRESYFTYEEGSLAMTVRMAQQAEPLRLTRMDMAGYPISPAVDTLARTIVGNEESPRRRAELIEQYMLRNFRYVPNPASRSPISLERFLLAERAGHCEYFAAGMVALLNAVGVPARIAGGFYAGQLNPLTGYYALRREDAHAWTEVWDGTRWMTFDSTPPSLRPGAVQMNPIRLYLAAFVDSLTFFWDRYVLTFGLGDQIGLFTDAFTWAGESIATLRSRLSNAGRDVLTRDNATLLAIFMGITMAIFLIQRRRRRTFDLLATYLAAQGIQVGPAMTMEEALRELRDQHPDAAEELAPLIALYEEETFSGSRNPQRSRELRRKLAELRT